MTADDMLRWMMAHEARLAFENQSGRANITLTARGKTATENFIMPSLDIMDERFQDMIPLSVECLIGRLDLIIGS